MEEPGKLKRALIDATAGAIAGGISRTVTSPLDVIKIRFQVPLKLQPHEVPLNKGSIYISKRSPPPVVGAYAVQFQKDFSDFLKCRSEEMVIGGRMVLILAGRKILDPTSEEATFQWNLLAQVFMNMVEEGYIAEQEVDCFNLPYYTPCAMELETEIQREGSFFLKCLRLFEVPWDACQDNSDHIEQIGFLSEKLTRGQSMANCLRAVLESILASHFGGDIIENLFSRYGKVLEDYISRKKPTITNMVASLVRKS